MTDNFHWLLIAYESLPTISGTFPQNTFRYPKNFNIQHDILSLYAFRVIHFLSIIMKWNGSPKKKWRGHSIATRNYSRYIQCHGIKSLGVHTYFQMCTYLPKGDAVLEMECMEFRWGQEDHHQSPRLAVKGANIYKWSILNCQKCYILFTRSIS